MPPSVSSRVGFREFSYTYQPRLAAQLQSIKKKEEKSSPLPLINAAFLWPRLNSCVFCPLATMAVDCYHWCSCYSNNLMPR